MHKRVRMPYQVGHNDDEVGCDSEEGDPRSGRG